jgi:hypothetical protein
MLKFYLKCNDYNKAFSDFFCTVILSLRRKRVLPQKMFTFLKLYGCIPGVLRRKFANKFDLNWLYFTKNGYHFTKITTLLRKLYLKMSKLKFKFYLIFTWVSQMGWFTPLPHPPPPVATSLDTSLIVGHIIDPLPINAPRVTAKFNMAPS